MTALDPEIREAAAQVPPQTTWDPAAMRAAGDAALAGEAALPDGIVRTVRWIEGPGGPLELRVHAPSAALSAGSNTGSSTGVTTAILSIHGGGFVAGRAAFDDAWNAQLAAASGAVVVSPDYRLAPEHPAPAAREDCLAAWRWLTTQRPFARCVVYGDSAGGNLAEGLTLWTLDHEDPVPDEVILIEPVLDDRLDTESMRNGDYPVWNRESARSSWEAVLGGREADAYSAPARRETLEGHPFTRILANQCDPLRDEDIEFARRLSAAGVPTELCMMPGTCHGVLGLDGPALADRAREVVLGWVREAAGRGE